MNNGTTSAQRINEYLDIQESQRAFMESVDHPADANQGRGLDHLAGPSYFSSVVWWLIAGVVCCLLATAKILMGGPHEQ
jgi:hypothetical protein